MLRTALTERWSIRYPILNASMTPAAGADLARAVSQAGGLGVFGLDWREERASLASQLDALRAAPDLPFGVGVVAWAIDEAPHLLEMAIEARPRFVCISFGDLAPLAGRLGRQASRSSRRSRTARPRSKPFVQGPRSSSRREPKLADTRGAWAR